MRVRSAGGQAEERSIDQREGKEPKLEKKQIYANGQTVEANLYFETDRAIFENAWSMMAKSAAATL